MGQEKKKQGAGRQPKGQNAVGAKRIINHYCSVTIIVKLSIMNQGRDEEKPSDINHNSGKFKIVTLLMATSAVRLSFGTGGHLR